MSDPLAPFEKSIDREYQRLGHTLGWRFLYSPASTLASSTRLAFVGQNPGDNQYYDPIVSSEKGNAYHVEGWWGARQDGVLLTQVRRLYDALAVSIGGTTGEELMDHTLTLNLCPFRSPGWERLPRRAESIEFSKRLWSSILDIVEPPVIVCNGKVVLENLELVFLARRAALRRRESRPIAWGTYEYTVARYTTKRGSDVTMVGFPNLSRFAIFGRPASRQATAEIIDVISAALRRAPITS
jgi:hypothetical protein